MCSSTSSFLAVVLSDNSSRSYSPMLGSSPMPNTITQSAWRMHVCVHELLTAESAMYSTMRNFCSCSASHPAAFSFPIRVNACRPRWSETDAWLRNAVGAPTASSAVCSLRANGSIGMLRENGRIATFFRLMFPRERSAAMVLCAVSSSVRTREEIMRRSLGCKTGSMSTNNVTSILTELLFVDFCDYSSVLSPCGDTATLTELRSH